MTAERLFCSTFKIPFIDHCMLMSEWGVHWQAFGVTVSLFLAIIGGWKFLHDISQIRKHQDDQEALRRTEFFLAQHRRLFDDEDLFSVLKNLDGDYPSLASEEFWDKNRKFLTFIEEIELLIRSGKLQSDTACYMFGYYAHCARDGKNFNAGINTAREHWAIFQDFCERHEKFRLTYPQGPGKTLML